MSAITERKQDVYKYLIEHASEAPSVREICKALGIKSTSTVFHILHQLEDDGLIDMAEGKRRNVSIARDSSSVMVPVLGTVAAGVPVLAQESIESFITFDTTRKEAGELFALHVKGDSMTGIGIMDGDVIIARQCESAENGEIIVALVDDEATVKRFYNMGDHIELRAENPGFPPLPPYREVTVLGKVVANFRYYE